MRKKELLHSDLSLTLIDESTSKSAKAANAVLNFISRFLIVFALSVGGIFTFSSMMNIKAIDWINYVVIAAASLIFTCCYKTFKKNWLVLLISAVIVAAAGLFMLSPVITGFQLLYDSAVKSIYDAMYWTAPDPLIVWDDSYISNTTYCMAMLSVIVTSLVAFFAVGKTQFIGAFLVTFPLFELGAAFGCVTDRIPFAFLIAGWAAMLTLHISNRQRNSVKHRNGDKVNNHKQFVYENKSSRFGGSAIVMATAVFLCFAIITNTLTSSGFARSESLNSLRKTVKYTALDIYDRITGFDHDASLKEGNLAVLGDRKILGREYATLQMPDVGQTIYLKGYVGSIYTGTSWEDFDSNTYEQLNTAKEAFSKKNYIIPTLTGDLLYGDFGNRRLKLAEFKLSDFRREKDYTYAPSGIVSDASITAYEDLYATPSYTDSYSYEAYYNLADYLTLPYTSSYQSKTFQKGWSEYAKFVQSNYTLLPEGIDEIAKLGQQLKGDTIYETVDKVREFLSTNTEYSDSVQKLPEDKDFASYFLFEKGVGYSAHYATAATVMLRSLGVPARYVEGFFVHKDDISKADGDSRQKTITLTDGNSHAWIEIFDAQYGWIPVEVTNGYYSGSFAAMMQQAIDTAENKFDDDEKKEDKKTDKTEASNQEEQADEPLPDEPVEENNDQLNYQESNVLLYIIIGALVLVALMLIFVIALITRRCSIISKRKKIFNSSDYRRQVIFGFELLRKMLKFKKIKFEDTYTFDEFRKIVQENFEVEEETEISLQEIFLIYQKAMFSKLLITEEDADKVLDFIDEYGYGIYSYLTVAYRLKWKYIDIIS